MIIDIKESNLYKFTKNIDIIIFLFIFINNNIKTVSINIYKYYRIFILNFFIIFIF